ncbi:MAG: beta-mannosidase [Candidatus Sumerlaeia bacterium]
MKTIVNLNPDWTLYQREEHGRMDKAELEKWMAGNGDVCKEALPAEMPAQAHDVLMANDKIEDVMKLGNCEKSQWIGEQDWVYVKEFSKPEQQGQTFLNFRGLDTFADIYLNGKLLLFADDCYLPVRMDVTKLLQDRNLLLVHFYAPRSYLDSLPNAEELKSSKAAYIRYPRKPAEDFNFFNGARPAFISIGIYDDVRLEVVDQVEIEDFSLRPKLNDDYSRGEVEVMVALMGASKVKGEVKCAIIAPDGKQVDEAAANFETDSGGGADLKLAVKVDKPELWYPLGHGAHPLYTVKAIISVDGDAKDSAEKRIGFRELKMRKIFDYTVNGIPVKLWGANITPLPRAGHVWDRDACVRMMEWVENANMISMRAWGPGQPFNEHLFDEADERGILMWAEFAHTGGPFPYTEDYRARYVAEATRWVKEWKHHPSIFMWCGGNETYLGIDVDSPDANRPDRKIFEKDYKEVCERLDPDRFYHENSPFLGAFDNAADQGDTHIRNYGHFLPGADYPVMPTENIRITIATRPTLEKHLGPDLEWPEGFSGKRTDFNDPVIPMNWVEKLCPDLHWINLRVGYVEHFFDADGTPDSLLFRMGAGTSAFIRDVIEKMRRGKPHWKADGPRVTMGHYWWKFNDTWPMIYASLIDDQLQPNMSYYAMRRALNPLLLSIDVLERVYLWIVNDSAETIQGQLRVRVLDQEGLKSLNEMKVDVQVKPGDSQLITNLDEFGMIYSKNPIYAELLDADGKLVSDSVQYMCTDRHNWFPEAKLELKRDGDSLVISTDAMASWVHLKGEGLDWDFEDNFFHLTPQREKSVRLLHPDKKGAIEAKAQYSPHVTKLEW